MFDGEAARGYAERRRRLRSRALDGLLFIALGCGPPQEKPKAPPAVAPTLLADGASVPRGSTPERDDPKPRVPQPYPVECVGDEQLAECRLLGRVDTLLADDDPRGATKELTEFYGSPDLAVWAQEGLTLPGEDGSVSKEIEYWRGLVVARCLLFSGSLSYGQGDDRTRSAGELLEHLLRSPAPPSLAQRAELDAVRARLSLGEGQAALKLAGGLAQRRPTEPEVQASLGVALLAVGRVEESIGPLERARELDPDEPERQLVLGTAQMLLGDTERAERSFRGALANATKNRRSPGAVEEILARCYGDLGAVLLLRGQAEQGRSYLQRALGLRPRQATYRVNLAYAHYLLGDFEEAEREARRATEADADLVSAWLNLGLAQASRGKFSEARSSFTHAQALDPEDPRPRQSLEDLAEALQRSSPASSDRAR